MADFAALSREYAEVLEFERETWRYLGTRESAIGERFAWSPARHAQVVGHVIDLPEAMAYDPTTVTRLRRLRDRRAAQRDPNRRDTKAVRR